ncbi:hypothetical protein CPB85DRAFT_577252 [Mucidula mucida]|nr:hypothetical protein CPB85DRAFT_577252 [Mucidula mucida]
MALAGKSARHRSLASRIDITFIWAGYRWIWTFGSIRSLWRASYDLQLVCHKRTNACPTRLRLWSTVLVLTDYHRRCSVTTSSPEAFAKKIQIPVVVGLWTLLFGNCWPLFKARKLRRSCPWPRRTRLFPRRDLFCQVGTFREFPAICRNDNVPNTANNIL